MVKVLLVDDDIPTISDLCTIAEKNGHEIYTAYSGNKAIEIIKTHGNTIDRILTDTQMEDGDGIALLSWIYENRPGQNRPLTHIHSSIDQCLLDGEIVDLPEYVPKTFEGTKFGIKDIDYTSASKFLKR